MLLRTIRDRALNRLTLRVFSTSLLLLCLVSLTGCVYLRLLAIKNQLAKFDKFFQVEIADSFTLHFLEPKLYGEDIVFLTELQPSGKEAFGGGEDWTFRFKKMISETELDTDSNVDIAFIFRMNEDDKLVSLSFSPILLRMAPPEFLEQSIRSLGGAKIDKKNRRIQGDADSVAKLKRELPRREDVLQHLGKPFSEETVDDLQKITYRYRLETVGTPPDKEKRRISNAQLYFDPDTGELLRFYGRFAGLKISINYRKLVEERFVKSESAES